MRFYEEIKYITVMDIKKNCGFLYSFIYTLYINIKGHFNLIFCKLNFAKTIYFNFKYFSFNTAIHFPVLIYNRTSLHKMGGGNNTQHSS